MFEYPGLFVWNAQNLPGFLPEEMKAGGFRWIAIDLHDGVELVEKTDYRALIAQYRHAGLDVAGWGVLRTQPEEEAELAAELCAKYDLHAYIANGERELGYTQESGPSGDCFGRSDVWTATFRARTDMELGFSSYAIYANHDAHYSVWIEAGAVAMPQTYLNEFTWATPLAGVEGAIDVKQPHNTPNGWPRQLVYPTIGNYPVDGVHLPPAQEYAELLRQAQVVSFSIYLGELVQQGELQHYSGVCVPAPAPEPEPEPPSIPKPTPAPKPPGPDPSSLPFTGPCYGPSDPKGPTTAPTVAALKIAMRRLGFGSFPELDEYTPELEEAMRKWQQRLQIRPASGHYGKGSYAALLRAVTDAGEPALDELAVELIRLDKPASS
jgi:hypothetical protein